MMHPRMERIDLDPATDPPFAFFPEGILPRGLRAGISLCAAGDMDPAREDVLPYRGRLFARLGIEASRVLRVRQVHSRTVVAAENSDMQRRAWPEADGMAAAGGPAVLAITVADCLPVFLADRATGAFALVHSGWKGTGIAAEAVSLMGRAYGSRPGDIVAALGPCIGPCCYGVPEDRYRLFLEGYGSRAAFRGSDGGFRVDLREANAVLLERAGTGGVFGVGDCTCCSPSFGSFRREGPSFTRMIALIGTF
jgi:YfiH family protein